MNRQIADAVRPESGQVELRELTRRSAEALEQMFEPQTRLFCHRVIQGPDGLILEGSSPRYTLMSLLGLQRWELAGGLSPVSVQRTLDALLADASRVDNIGDLGLMLWLSAVVSPSNLKDIYSGLGIGSAWGRFTEVPEGRTMELSWFLTGLAYAAPALPRDMLDSARELAVRTFKLLVKNQGSHGFFGHQGTATLLGKLRGRIGSFADQVYPIYAFTQFAKAFGDASALDRAGQCADAICRAQGPLGQWWWHYNATSGRTFQRYPVYSVHQDGMAPMALWAVGEASGRDYRSSIYRGLAWIYGKNELGRDMRDPASGLIWRCVYGSGWRKRTRELLDAVGIGPTQISSDFKVLLECRPYHLGWLLYAFAGRA